MYSSPDSLKIRTNGRSLHYNPLLGSVIPGEQEGERNGSETEKEGEQIQCVSLLGRP